MNKVTNDRIVINEVAGGGPAKDLLGCFFQPKGDGTFKFHDKGGAEKGKDLRRGSIFKFHLDGRDWTLTIDSISDSTASGLWSESKHGKPDVPDQTYQAQAGTVTPVKSKKSAASSAKA